MAMGIEKSHLIGTSSRSGARQPVANAGNCRKIAITPTTSQGQPVSSQPGIPVCMPMVVSILAKTDPCERR